MPKTLFENGTIVLSEFLNSIFNTGGGHAHDGGDEDGHAGKIDLESEVDGDLPIALVDGLAGVLDGLDGRVEDLEDQIETGDISVDVTSEYFSTPANATWKYKKNTVTNEVSILIPDMFGSHGTNTQLQFTPHSGNWPSAILATLAQSIGGVMLSRQGALSEFRLGTLTIPNTANSDDNIFAMITEDSAVLTVAGFGLADSQPKGIFRQTIHYIVE